MILVGIDDTDVAGSPGTNQLARALVAELADVCRCVRIVRHQLLVDPRVPCTTKNGSASILLERTASVPLEEIVRRSRGRMRSWYVAGSDPGLCVAETVSAPVSEFGRLCQRQLVEQEQARCVAAAADIHLEGLGGTDGGVIGALAAVGLAATGDDGRVVHCGRWTDDLSGVQPWSALAARGVEVRDRATNRLLDSGQIDVGKHLRPNRRRSHTVLFVERDSACGGADFFRAVKLP